MMMIKKFRSRVISESNPIHGIHCVEFESLNGKFKYKPGQFLHLSLDSDYDGTGQWPESRCFSIQSDPEEEYIKITYSVKGRFTKLMEESLRKGSNVWLKLPYGDLFSQKHNKINTVFIAGGTGITPFLSLFSSHDFIEYINPKIFLGFKNKVNNIYNEYLENPNMLTKVKQIFYEDIDGIIDMNMIFLESGFESDYFISGPPMMIKNFRQYLIKKGVKIHSVLTDEWE